MSAKPEVPWNRSHRAERHERFDGIVFQHWDGSFVSITTHLWKKQWNNPLITQNICNFLFMCQNLLTHPRWVQDISSLRHKPCYGRLSLKLASKVVVSLLQWTKLIWGLLGLSHPGFRSVVNFSPSYRSKEDCRDFSVGIPERQMAAWSGKLRLELYCWPRVTSVWEPKYTIPWVPKVWKGRQTDWLNYKMTTALSRTQWVWSAPASLGF